MNLADVDQLDWAKGDGLLPAIVQDARSGAVLMLGFMNREALRSTLAEKRVTFWSRTRQRLWTKGETSGHWIAADSVTVDCDRDTLLVLGRPAGPVCHTGAPDCFPGHPDAAASELAFLDELEEIIAARIADAPESSYTAKLHARGPMRIAQKVGEEGLEVALAAVGGDDPQVVGESADLVFHLLLLLKSRGLSLRDVVRELAQRHAAKS
jgi:phosphoribosyl-AMP cyclohydrolase / phosphoribosyl-ATP pyrophosphohydrolase